MKLTDEQRKAMEVAIKPYIDDFISCKGSRKRMSNVDSYRLGARAGYAAAKSETCKWTTYVDLEGSYWATQCVEVFWEKHNFCPYCGRKIQVVERDKTGENYAE